MKKKFVLGTLFTLLLFVAVFLLINRSLRKVTLPPFQGQVEVRSVKVSSKLAGRLDSLLVRRGERVQAGQLLFVLETPEVEAKLHQAQAARKAATAQQSKALTGARTQEVEAARSLWLKAQAGSDLAQKSYARVKNLYDGGVVSAQKHDEALASLRSAQTSLAAAQAQYNMALEGARKEDKSAAAALVEQASGVVSEVTSYLADARQYSPINGEVSSLIAEEGELVGSGYPVLTLLDMSDMWATFHIREDLLPGIGVGSLLQGYIPALDTLVSLRVDFMAVEADYATWSATGSQGGFDVRSFEVQARPETAIPALRPGMSVIVNRETR
ncbi:MAG: HlyD family secretion protein [Bacteroidales bacterium]